MRWLWFFPLILFAYQGSTEEGSNPPWLTGPLIATSGNIVRSGHWNIEPYVYAFAHNSFYNNQWKSQSVDTLWNLHFRVPVWFGLTKWADVRVMPVWNWNYRNGAGCWALGDWNAQLDIQLHKDQLPHLSWWPSIKITIRETFPTGKYQNLNPNKLGTDAGGRGAWMTTLILGMSKILHCYGDHYLNLYFNGLYGIPTNVHVKGFNAYGGGYGANGTVHPERVTQFNVAAEYTLTRNWALACDVVGLWHSKTTFSGTAGLAENPDENPAALPAVNENQASIQYSLAPAIEYNWSNDLGLIIGSWFTVAGKNSSHFSSAVVALNYYY